MTTPINRHVAFAMADNSFADLRTLLDFAEAAMQEYVNSPLAVPPLVRPYFHQLYESELRRAVNSAFKLCVKLPAHLEDTKVALTSVANITKMLDSGNVASLAANGALRALRQLNEEIEAEVTKRLAAGHTGPTSITSLHTLCNLLRNVMRGAG